MNTQIRGLLAGLLLVSLSSCDEFHVRQSSLEWVVSLSENNEEFLVYCDLFEGGNCALIPGKNVTSHGFKGLPDRLIWASSQEANDVIDDIGRKFVELSDQNSILINCLLVETVISNCKISRGAGEWIDLRIKR